MSMYFITGTDTGIGKTYTSVKLMQALQKQGLTTIGLKPLASGCEIVDQKPVNEDALALQKAASLPLPYEAVNPIAFLPPIAPHIAANITDIPLSVASLLDHCQTGLAAKVDITFIEGVGGWLTPLNKTETMADFAKALNCPIILVVGMRLGCLNHTLLTYQAINQMRTPLAGWVANILNPNMAALTENIETLKEKLKCNFLGTIPFNSDHAQFNLRFLAL